jgi:hypothetical protein
MAARHEQPTSRIDVHRCTCRDAKRSAGRARSAPTHASIVNLLIPLSPRRCRLLAGSRRHMTSMRRAQRVGVEAQDSILRHWDAVNIMGLLCGQREISPLLHEPRRRSRGIGSLPSLTGSAPQLLAHVQWPWSDWGCRHRVYPSGTLSAPNWAALPPTRIEPPLAHTRGACAVNERQAIAVHADAWGRWDSGGKKRTLSA